MTDQRKRFQRDRVVDSGFDYLTRELKVDGGMPQNPRVRKFRERKTKAEKGFEKNIAEAKKAIDFEMKELKEITSDNYYPGLGSKQITQSGNNDKPFDRMSNEDLVEQVTRLRKLEILLKKRLSVRQKAFIRREQQLKRREKELMKKLLEATTFKHGRKEIDFSTQFESLREKKSDISRKIDSLRGEKLQLIREKEEDIQQRVEELKKKYEKKLEIAKNQNFTSQRDFFEKTRLLKKCLVDIRKKAEDLNSRNMKLEEENKRLKVEFGAQKNSENKWAKKNALYKRDNDKLRKIVKDCELEIEEQNQVLKLLQQENQNLRSQLRNAESSKSTSQITGSEFTQKLQKQIYQEQQKFRRIKKVYLNILAERTELEIFLKQCIDDCRKKLKIYQGGTTMVEFEEKDRDTVIKILLSKEKVLNLLFDKTLPFNNFKNTNRPKTTSIM